MKCPTCGKGSNVFKCDHCGDVRCNNSGQGGCNNSTGPFKIGGRGASLNIQCKVCKKGKYRKL